MPRTKPTTQDLMVATLGTPAQHLERLKRGYQVLKQGCKTLVTDVVKDPELFDANFVVQQIARYLAILDMHYELHIAKVETSETPDTEIRAAEFIVALQTKFVVTLLGGMTKALNERKMVITDSTEAEETAAGMSDEEIAAQMGEK